MVIRLICGVAAAVNADAAVGDALKVVFVPDYNVSKAEMIIPASDISQHISTAGTEASGTSNMKFVLNGGLILGTVDGANIEIAREIGEDNIFLFGHLADEVEELRHRHRYGTDGLDPDLAAVCDEIRRGTFGDPDLFAGMLDSVQARQDYYLVGDDFQSYLAAQRQVDEVFQDQEEWTRRNIVAVSRMGFFSSDRAILQYAESIWNVEPLSGQGKQA
jgi:starch phosphorylase